MVKRSRAAAPVLVAVSVYLYVGLLLCVYLSLPVSEAVQCTIAESELVALEDLYDSCTGSHWRWSSDLPSSTIWTFPTDVSVPCSDGWQGLGCTFIGSNESNTCNITVLDLMSYELAGSLPSSINGLTNLVNLNVSVNRINSTIPQSLSLMTSLQIVSLSDNTLAGPLPDFDGLVNLQSFNADTNNITSSIPASLCSASLLQQFSIQENNVTGSLPECLYDLSQLVELIIRDNKISGSLSANIGSLLSVEMIDLGINEFSGSIPSQLGTLSVLSYFAVDDNRLASRIPTQLSQVSTLEVIVLSINSLDGSLPTELGRLSSLKFLAVDGNQLSGSIPTEFEYLSSLQLVNLAYNSLRGSLPSQLSELVQLESLNVSNNFIAGSIPVDYGNLSSLSRLDLSSNRLTGPLSSTLCHLVHLTLLYANNNSLTGELPNCIGGVASLLYLQLQNNYLGGDIPESIAHLQDLVYLDISSNLFVGSIPTYIAELSSLLVLRIQNNSITGTIPTEFTKLVNLTVLNLSVTKLHGTIPLFLAELSNLQYLNLSYAHFIGSLPNEIVSLPKLFSLYVNRNQLGMELPGGLLEGTPTSLKYLSLAHNKFNGTVSLKLVSMPQLQLLDFYDNDFTGPLPFTEGLQCNVLYYFDVGRNSFTGELPNNWTTYKSLQYFSVDHNELGGTLPALTLHQSASVSLYQFNVQNNNFHGTIPNGLWTHTALNELLLSDNGLSGTISSGVMQLQQLINLDLSSNNFKGNLRDAFVSPLPSLLLLNLANNSFSEHIPDTLISPKLSSLDLSSNCFSGTLSSYICTAKSLSSLLLNTLSSEDMCQVDISPDLKFAFKGIFPYKKMDGSIPDCFFRLLNLTYLQLGGNKLVGTIPNMPVVSSLVNLDLSFNTLTGTIPDSIQRSGQFKYLSLQSNRLTGTLLPDFAVSNNNYSDGNTTELYLSVNRLSGQIPRSFYHVNRKLDILIGNLFDCKFSDPLPPADQNHNTFNCGSRQFNTAMYAWLGCVLFAITVLFACYLFLRRYESHEEDPRRQPINEQLGRIRQEDLEVSVEMRLSSKDLGLSASLLQNVTRVLRTQAAESSMTEQSALDQPLRPSFIVATAFSSFQQWLHYDFARNEMLSSTYKFFVGLQQVWRGLALWSLLYLGMLFFYLVLKVGFQDVFRTVTIQELWVSTSLFLHGYIPVIFLSLVLIISITMILSVVNVVQLRSIVAQRSQLREEQRANQRYHTFLESLFRGGCIDYFIYPALAHTINFVFAVTANAVYVTYLPSIPTHYVFLFQATMSIAKTLWINLYIPFVMKRLAYLSVTSKFQTQVTMLLISYLLAPLLATLGANKNCLYYVFATSPQISSLFPSTVSYCYAVITVSIVEQQPKSFAQHAMTQYQPEQPHVDYNTNINCILKSSKDGGTEFTIPPFIYNYNCGFSFLADYIPVLLYSYLISAIFVPLFRLFLLYCSQSYLRRRFFGERLYNLFIRDTIHDYQGRIEEQRTVTRASLTESFNVPQSRANSIASDTSEIAKNYVIPLFDGSALIARRTLDVATMMTFGMACPLLAFMITISVYVQCIVWRLLIGKYLNQVGEGSTLALARLERSFGDGLSHGTVGALRVAILVVSGFWAFIFFDMVGDVYGTRAAIGTAAGSFVFMPLLAFVLFSLKGRFGVHDGRPFSPSIQMAQHVSNLSVLRSAMTPEMHAQMSNSDFATSSMRL
jgi:Leucine-rich repeat (LRR) protein